MGLKNIIDNFKVKFVHLTQLMCLKCPRCLFISHCVCLFEYQVFLCVLEIFMCLLPITPHTNSLNSFLFFYSKSFSHYDTYSFRKRCSWSFLLGYLVKHQDRYHVCLSHCVYGSDSCHYYKLLHLTHFHL